MQGAVFQGDVVQAVQGWVQTACDVQSTGSGSVLTASVEQADVVSGQAAGSGLQVAGQLHVAGVD